MTEICSDVRKLTNDAIIVRFVGPQRGATVFPSEPYELSDRFLKLKSNNVLSRLLLLLMLIVMMMILMIYLTEEEINLK